VADQRPGELTVGVARVARGWCPRCDAVRAVDDVCPECRATLFPLDDRPPRPARPEQEQPVEPAAVVQPPKGRLRVAAAVAAVVLVGLAFVAGRSTGGTTARATTTAATSATTTTTVASQAAAQRQLGWKAGPKKGISVELVSITRSADGDVSGPDFSGIGQDSEQGDSTSTLHLRLNGLGTDRRLLGVRGLRLVDSGGGVFATPEERPIGGEDAVPAVQDRGPGAYMLNLGTTPDLESLSGIDLDALILSSSPATGTRVDLPAPGAWPSRPPLRDVSDGGRDLSVPVSLGTATSSRDLRLRLSGAFVGGGRAVMVLERSEDLATDPMVMPLAASVLDGDWVVCSRQEFIGGPARDSPLVVVDCPMRPTAQLGLRLAAGVDTVDLGAKLRD
jgi:hypothetical protein